MLAVPCKQPTTLNRAHALPKAARQMGEGEEAQNHLALVGFAAALVMWQQLTG